MSRHCPTAANACQSGQRLHGVEIDGLSSCTCILGRYFGLFSTSILRNPTPIAPEETITTRCPSLTSLTAVSTMRDRIDNKGSCVFSWTIELVPGSVHRQKQLAFRRLALRTQFDDNCEMSVALHAYLLTRHLLLDLAIVISLTVCACASRGSLQVKKQLVRGGQ